MYDALFVADHLRQPDRDELAATGHNDAMKALRASFLLSRIRCACDAKTGLPVALWGTRRELAGRGLVWMLGTDELPLYRMSFLRQSHRVLNEELSRFVLIHNWVDCRNELAIAWLRWLGFVMEPSEPFGVNGEPFIHFYKRGEKHV